MKHLTIAIIIFLTAVHLFAQEQGAQTGFAVIKEMTGTVELKIAGSQEWVPANIEDVIEGETIISTGLRSSVVLETGTSTITVRSLTSLSLKTLNDRNTETTDVDLRVGRIRVEVKPPAGSRASFNVQTPMTVASVRGTSFELDIINIKVTEGAVRYEPNTAQTGFASQPVLVIAGQRTWMDMDTGKTVNALDAAELSRALPPMPGQDSMPGVLRTQMEGFFVVEMTLQGE